ncbi:MAG: hypothetical protein E6K18_03600 [Methanobacteriota archaeon]|nr:MAG: hypothetical protein E6K18_03600 [Euryarchaeota archaeon]
MAAEPARDRLIESNPFVDVATHLFLEDIADKQGASGLNNYLMSLATNLAKSMPEEEYDTWDEFLEALKSGNSILTTFEEVFMPTKNCVVTRRSPFERGWQEYVKRVGSFSRIHEEVAEYYNSAVKPTAINSLHIIHQTFRAAASDRITVGGKRVKYAQVATVWTDGEKKIVPDEWLPVLLQKAGISRTELNMLLRNNADVWLLYTE